MGAWRHIVYIAEHCGMTSYAFRLRANQNTVPELSKAIIHWLFSERQAENFIL